MLSKFCYIGILRSNECNIDKTIPESISSPSFWGRSLHKYVYNYTQSKKTGSITFS